MSDPAVPEPAPSHLPPVRRRRRSPLTYVLVGVIVVIMVFVGIGIETNWYGLYAPATGQGTCPGGVTLSGAGANFFLALISQWQVGYTAATANQVNYNPEGAGAGIQAFEKPATVDFAATDEPLNATEIAGLPGTTLTLPVTGGAVVIIYNLPKFSGPLRLSGPLLADIYLGKISNWDNASLAANNSGLPSEPIITVHRLDAAGTTYVLTQMLSQDSSSWASGPGTSIQPNWPHTSQPSVAEKGNSALASYVSTTPYTIGYVDLADAISKGASIASVLNPSGNFIQPNVTNTQSAIDTLSNQPFPGATGNWANVSFVNSPGAGDYPLATLSYFLVLQNPGQGYLPSFAKTQVLVQWVDWAITSGQAYSRALDYIDPPPKLLQQDQNALAAVNYNGATIPPCVPVYPVTFTESGLPKGTNWTVTVNGLAKSSNTTSIAFAESNGSYSYSIGPVPGYVPSPSSGSVTVRGAALAVSIAFTVAARPDAGAGPLEVVTPPDPT